MELKVNISKNIFKYLLLAAIALVIFISIPKEGKFKFEYELNQPWQHDDLIATFTFPVKKSLSEISKEKQFVKSSFKPYYNKDSTVPGKISAEIRKNPGTVFNNNFSSLPFPEKQKVLNELDAVIQAIYGKGVIGDENQRYNRNSGDILNIISGKLMTEVPKEDLFTLSSAKNYLLATIGKNPLLTGFVRVENLFPRIVPDLSYNRELSEAKLDDEISSISLNKGVVTEGEKIIARGNLVTPEKFQVLESLKYEYKTQLKKGQVNIFLFSGYLLFILMVLTGFILYVAKNYRELFRNNKQLMLIFSNMAGWILVSSLVTRSHGLSLYVIPYCVLPIVLMSFYDRTISIFAYITVIFIVSLFAPNSYEFIFIELFTGIALVFGITRVKHLSRFIFIALYVLALYCLTYSSFKLLQITSLSEIEYKNYLWFGGNFVLTLLAYPLIYIFEKTFGFVSNITLIELSDINRKLLHDLSVKAPGTFQHSLQVANIAEAVIGRIGGNSLLARVGALYHDIGKMYAPQYFIENQKIFNTKFTFEEIEGSKKIIDHVAKGIEMAKQYNLPREIVSFIRSHHGTTRTEYFFRTYAKKFPDHEVSDVPFRYPGPKPVSKETAVVMIADSVEAALRSVREPNEETISELVDRVIDQKIKDKQFENAQITFREINMTKEIIKKIMMSIYHGRIEYPDDSAETEK